MHTNYHLSFFFKNDMECQDLTFSNVVFWIAQRKSVRKRFRLIELIRLKKLKLTQLLPGSLRVPMLLQLPGSLPYHPVPLQHYKMFRLRSLECLVTSCNEMEDEKMIMKMRNSEYDFLTVK